MVDADLLIAGAGAAGLAAAIAAADRGLSVVVAEASPSWRDGSNTAMSTSMIPAGGSRWQASAGVDDSPEVFLDDVRRKTGGQADPVVAHALVDVAPVLVAWLADACGIELELVTDLLYPGHSRLRCHAVADRSGATLLAGLLAALARRPGVELVVPLRLTGLLEPAPGSGSWRATLERPDGARETLDAHAVVLATNGFGARPDLVRRHLPEIADGLYFGGEGSWGDALAIGETLHADVAFLDAYQGHGSVAHPHGILLTWAAVVHGAVLVNASGERFGDETVGYSEFGRPVLEQPGREAWVIFDRRVDERCRAFADYQRCLEAGAVRWADDTSALAALTGAPAAALEQTLAAARACATGSAADVHGRNDWEAPLEAPYAAVRVTGALFHTQGGLRVGADAGVLRAGRPIPGLFAAGGAAAGISGHGAAGYLAGNGLLSALGLGYLAGSAAIA